MADVRVKVTQQSLSIVSVPTEGYSFERSLFPFSLVDLEVLSRVVEAYVLHDEVRFVTTLTPFCVNLLKLDPASFSLAHPYVQGEVSNWIRPVCDPDLVMDVREYHHAMNQLRGNSRGPLPLKVRTFEEWASLEQQIEYGFVRAEYQFSLKRAATFYPPAVHFSVIGAQVSQAADSAASLLTQFTKMRSAQIKEVYRLLRPQSIEFSPPLILAYVLASADTLRGVQRVLRELQSDSDVLKLKKLILQLGSSEPHEQIEMGLNIQAELRRILGLSRAPINFGETISMIPQLFADPRAGLSKFLNSLTNIDKLVEQLKTRSRLVLLRRLHEAIPSIKNFYNHLDRFFGPLNFSEAHLRLWLADPSRAVRFTRVDPNRLSTRDLESRVAINLLNERIAKSSRPT